MNKKKITIIALTKRIAVAMKNELHEIFSDEIVTEIRYSTDNSNEDIHDTNLIISHDPRAIMQFMPLIKTDVQVLITKRTISFDGIKKLESIPAGSKVAVSNITIYTTMETLTAIYQLGLNHVQLYPYYSDSDMQDDIEYIVSPIPLEFDIPPHITEVCIGHRPVDISTILDIIATLNISNFKSELILKKYQSILPSVWQGVQNTLNDKRTLMVYWKVLLKKFNEGVLIIDGSGKIIFSNPSISKTFNLDTTELLGKTLDELIRYKPALSVLIDADNIEDQLIQNDGKKIIINKITLSLTDDSKGCIIFCKEYNRLIEQQQIVQKQLVKDGLYSKYNFDDIKGKSKPLMEAIRICKKVSDSDASILLIGESGTGKEMFAGSIHTHSSRKDAPFVALNCATLPESLLESELFGYEEGAFTGAKKGGKTGLFEKAHNGTLFLDEIGEIPLILQARLLRALQEKEIIRLGGENIISVNTRIIAATNKDLGAMVEEGLFRRDLYFRLNIFQITLPSLKVRSSDIPIIIEDYSSKNDKAIRIEPSFYEFSNKYDWPGNVRELLNILEYVTTINDSILSKDSLPSYIKVKPTGLLSTRISTEAIKDKIIEIIFDRSQQGFSSGRRSIHTDLNISKLNVSEVFLRELLNELVDDGLIIIHKGRKGCELTNLAYSRLT